MGIFYRKTIRRGGARVNLTKSGISLSERVGPVTVNSRGRGSIRILPGLSFRFRRHR